MSAKKRNRLTEFLKARDGFGHPITLKYKNDSAYKSSIGGICSLISLSILTMYFAYLLVGTFQRRNFTIVNSLFKRDISIDNTTIQLNLDNFDIALGLNYAGDEEGIDDNLDLYFSQYYQITDLEYIEDAKIRESMGTDYYWNTTYVNSSKCDYGRLGGKVKKGIPTEYLKDYMCPSKDFQFDFIGNWNTQRLKMLQVVVDYCTQSYLDHQYPGKKKKCKTQEQADEIINDIYFEAPMLTQYFDEKDFSSNPIKSELNYQIYGELHPSISTKYQFKVSSNTVTLKDSIISSMLDNRELTYIDAKFNFIYYNEPLIDVNPLLTYEFFIDENVVTKDRAVGTVIDNISNVGGLMGIIFSIVSILIGWIQESLFHLSIIKKIFLYSEEDEDNHQNQKKVVKVSAVDNINTSRPNLTQSIDGLDNIDSANHRQDNRVDKIKNYISSLKAFGYYFKDLMVFNMRKMCVCVKKTRFKDALYDEGMTKLEDQFDLVKVFRTLRKIDLIASITLAKYQHELLPYMKSNVLGREREKDEVLATTLKTQNMTYSSIMKLVSKSESSKFDRRLLKNLDVLRETDHRQKVAITSISDNNQNISRVDESQENFQPVLLQSNARNDFKNSSSYRRSKKI